MNKKDESFKDFVLDQLQELGGVEARRMFGSFGLYRDETFIGIVHKGRLYFKTDASTVGEYRKRRMKPFRPNAKQTLKSYYRVPVDIIEDADKLAAWAGKFDWLSAEEIVIWYRFGLCKFGGYQRSVDFCCGAW